MKRTFPSLPEWTFEVKEVSVGIYEVTGHDRAGHTVSETGADAHAILEACKRYAASISEA